MRELLHPNFNILDGDKVFVENQDSTVDYGIVQYDVDAAAYVVVFYTSKHYANLMYNLSNEQVIDFVHDIGFDALNRVDDYNFYDLV